MFEHTSFEKPGHRMRWKGKREGKSWSTGQGRAFMNGTVTSKLWQIKKGIPNREDRQALAVCWTLEPSRDRS